LQQTSKRRSANDTNAAPIPGQPEMGLNYDPASERIADQISESATRLATEKDVGNEAEGGLQPSGVNLFTIHKLLRTFTDLPGIKKAEEEIDKRAKGSLRKRESTTVENTVAVLA